MSGDRFRLVRREYPQTWLLLDVVNREKPVMGQEVVDLSPGAIELREAARSMKGYADERGRWLELDERSRWPRLSDRHRRELSFGPVLGYCVERDTRERIHDGEPFRHLTIRSSSRILTPATSAEIGLYFYGRKPAVFGFVDSERTHGFIGYQWEPIARDDVRWLLERELGEGE